MSGPLCGWRRVGSGLQEGFWGRPGPLRQLGGELDSQAPFGGPCSSGIRAVPYDRKPGIASLKVGPDVGATAAAA